MKVLILAGGLGTRLSEYTESIPKPMVSIGQIPILMHIMNIYASYGHKDFYIALGYKSEVIKDYFLNYSKINRDFSINLKSGKVSFFEKEIPMNDWNVTLINTGINSLTGKRIKLMQKYLNDETFLLTYGDGLSDVNIDSLISFHENHKKILTMTAVRPPARFGELEINDNKVKSFKEKPQLHEGWINGGFFVVEPKFFDFIPDKNVMLERDPIENLTQNSEVMAYKHTGFWQCMDTMRDKILLENLFSKGAPWLKQ